MKNPKIEFNFATETFTLWKRFMDVTHLLKVLYEEKIGVLENSDLYDDIKKEDIQKIKKADLIREIFIKEKKTKAPIIILFSKNHPNSEIDKDDYEKNTSEFLKNYWHKIERDALELEREKKQSQIQWLDKW